MVCGPAPDGRARWTVRLIAEHAVRRGIADSLGRETVRVVLAKHDLKPWRKKMWCVPEVTTEYVARMEDLLHLYARPYRASAPVVALDERPVQLHDDARAAMPMVPGRERRADYEYKRRGTANVFGIVEPSTGRRLTHATQNRTGQAYVKALRKIAQRYRHAKTIHLVQDNLSTHSEKSLTDALGTRVGSALWPRFKIHYSPKHASWLNVAEIEAGLVARECLGKRRIPDLDTLKREVRHWRASVDRIRPFQWNFSVSDARRVFRYDGVKSARSEH